MLNNQRGGIISNLILVPAGVALMLGFFFLGYYVGSHKGKSAQNEALPPLPEVVSKNLPNPEEFTFYKTLTEKDGKTVSIDLKPKAASPEQAPAAPKEAAINTKSDKKAASSEAARKPASKTPAETKTASAKNSLRYTLQVSSHQERDSAEQEVRRMKQNGFAAFIVPSFVPGRGTWYRVRIGSFASKNSAEKLEKEVHAKVGVTPIITLE